MISLLFYFQFFIQFLFFNIISMWSFFFSFCVIIIQPFSPIRLGHKWLKSFFFLFHFILFENHFDSSLLCSIKALRFKHKRIKKETVSCVKFVFTFMLQWYHNNKYNNGNNNDYNKNKITKKREILFVEVPIADFHGILPGISIDIADGFSSTST